MDSGWGAGAKTLSTAALSLVYSIAEHCAPVWCCNAHTRLIDSVLNDALKHSFWMPAPHTTNHLPPLLGIQPTEPCDVGGFTRGSTPRSPSNRAIFHGRDQRSRIDREYPNMARRRWSSTGQSNTR